MGQTSCRHFSSACTKRTQQRERERWRKREKGGNASRFVTRVHCCYQNATLIYSCSPRNPLARPHPVLAPSLCTISWRGQHGALTFKMIFHSGRILQSIASWWHYVTIVNFANWRRGKFLRFERMMAATLWRLKDWKEYEMLELLFTRNKTAQYYVRFYGILIILDSIFICFPILPALLHFCYI